MSIFQPNVPYALPQLQTRSFVWVSPWSKWEKVISTENAGGGSPGSSDLFWIPSALSDLDIGQCLSASFFAMANQTQSRNIPANQRQYFQVFLADPEAYSAWQNIVPAEPERAVRCISQQLTSRGKTKDGDTVADISPALIVIGDAAELDVSTWIKLVDAGVGDALCINVRDMVSNMSVLPNMPAHLVKQAKARVS